MIEQITYIPKEKIHLLNAIAAKHGKKSLSENCPILNGEWNIPVSLALPDSAEWVRCMIPTSVACDGQVLLDVKRQDFEALPVRIATDGETEISKQPNALDE